VDERGGHGDVYALVYVGCGFGWELFVDGFFVGFCCCDGWGYFPNHVFDADVGLVGVP